MPTYTTINHVSIDPLVWDMFRQTHILIGGATRSGKSVLLNSFIHGVMQYYLPLLDTEESADRQAGLILIDPKRGVEFGRYKDLPHTIAYAYDDVSAVSALNTAVNEMNRRYDRLKATGQRKQEVKPIYVIVDEMADITGNKKVTALIDRIARLGGAANIHLLIATQQPLITSGAITSSTKANMTAQIALRCEEAKDSRAIIRKAGAELLPLNGYCLYRTPYNAEVRMMPVPYTPDTEIDGLVSYWLAQMPHRTTGYKQYKRAHTLDSWDYRDKNPGIIDKLLWLFCLRRNK